MIKYKLPNKPFEYQNFVNGEYINSLSNETFERKSPAHGNLIGTYQLSSKQDTEQAISVAKKAFKSNAWS